MSAVRYRAKPWMRGEGVGRREIRDRRDEDAARGIRVEAGRELGGAEVGAAVRRRRRSRIEDYTGSSHWPAAAIPRTTSHGGAFQCSRRPNATRAATTSSVR